LFFLVDGAPVGSKKNQVIIGIIIGLGFMALPLFIEGYWIRVVSSIFMYAIITGALNIIAGFAGYAAFGNIVFFGIGAYTTAMLMLRAGFPWWTGVFIGAILASIFAVLVGLPILRLRGHYFAIATLGINRAVEQIALDWGSLTGGGKGITLPLPTMEIQSFYAMIYFIMFGLLLLTILTNFVIARGRLGYALRAIRDNEDAAEASGIFAPTCKVIAWAISAFITGLTGGVFAYWFSFIEPATVFDIMIAVKAFVMMMLGGAGTVLGPIIGAFLLELISETVWGQFLTIHMLILGIIVVGVVIFIPRGVLDLFRKKISLSALIRNIKNQSV
jgi:branched-chain amino acid transport system permease protein